MPNCMSQSAQIKDKEQSCPTSSCGHQPLQEFVKPFSVSTTYSQAKSQGAGETDGSSIDHRLHLPLEGWDEYMEKCGHKSRESSHSAVFISRMAKFYLFFVFIRKSRLKTFIFDKAYN